MELFNEVKNRYFQLVFRIINECIDGKTKSDIVRLIDEGEFEQKVIGKNQKSFADLVLNRCSEDENLNLLTEKEGRFYPSLVVYSRILKLFLFPMQRFPDGLAVLFTSLVTGIPGKLELKNLSAGGSIPPLL